MRTIRLNGLKLALGERESSLKEKAACALGIEEAGIVSLAILKKALDARRSRPPFFVYAVKIELNDTVNVTETMPDDIQIQTFQEIPDICPAPVKGLSSAEHPVVVIGSGPAGLFAAYTLVTAGVSVLLLERGSPLDQRVRDVQTFWQTGLLDQESNVLFGEGGAGTFSDGKLTSRTKNPYAGWVKKVLVDMGASSAILTDAKPHVGTDQLRDVVLRIRERLMERGCVIRFGSRVTDFIIRQDKLAAVIINGEEEIIADHVILAIGQSADDTYRCLYDRGVKMQSKPFAMGLRVEHPQDLINTIQYGKWHGHPLLPPAEYFVTASVNELNRSVYTFCMCPGGQVIGCSAFPGLVITNGMSKRKRDGEFANSAVVVNVRVEDFETYGKPLAGLDFRGLWEKKAFEAGGGDYSAPAQRITEFVEQRFSGAVGQTSFLPGVKAAPLADVMPEFVTGALKDGLKQFEKKMPGFISESVHLIGVETRTSSPVRICRRADAQSENVRGLYPCGEGAGYAGGIISSALDGIKAAQSVIAVLSGSP